MKRAKPSSIHDDAGCVLVEWAQRQVFLRDQVRSDEATHVKVTTEALWAAPVGDVVFRDAEAMR